MNSTMDDLIGRERRRELEAEANVRHDEMHAALTADDHGQARGLPTTRPRPYSVSVPPVVVPMKDQNGHMADYELSIGRDPEGNLVMGQVEQIGTSGQYRFAGQSPNLPANQHFAPQRVDASASLLDALSTTDEQKRAGQGKVFEIAVGGRTRAAYATGETLQRAMATWDNHAGHDPAVKELKGQTTAFRDRAQAQLKGIFRDPDPEPAPAPAEQSPTKDNPFAAAFRNIVSRRGEQPASQRASERFSRTRPRPVIDMDEPSQGPDF